MRIVFISILFLIISSCSLEEGEFAKIIYTVDSLTSEGKSDEAVTLIQSKINEAPNQNLKAALYVRYGICKEIKNESDSSIYYFENAVNIWESTSNKSQLPGIYMNIGILYSAKGNYQEAMRNFSKALKNSNNKYDSLSTYNSICVLYINRKMYDSAYSIIQKCLVRFEPNMTASQSYYIYFGKGVYFNSKNIYDSALFYLNNCLNKAPSDLYTANTFTTIAGVYKEMQQHQTALTFLDSATQLYGQEGWDDNRQFDYDTYRAIYDSLGDYKKAYQYAQLYRTVSEKIYKENNEDAMIGAVAEAKTSAERAKTELAKRSLLFTVLALGLVALLAFLAFRNTRIKQKANVLLTQQKQQVQQLADQLAVANDTKARLFSTIGHDLRSPVSSLYASLKMQELKGNGTGGEMSEQTVRLLDTLEELLIWSKSQMDGFKVQPVKINVRYLFEDLKEFYTNAAVIKNISIVNDTAKDVVIRADENLLKTIFRNAISNAIANTLNDSTIRFTATSLADGKICMAVSNPCCEESFQKFKANFDDAAVKSGAYGLGIVLMKEFAQKLGGHIELAYTNDNASLNLCV